MTYRKINSKEVGLDVGLLLFKNFLDTDYLHYGLFKDNLDSKVINLPKAQINYAEFLISIIPNEVKSILDVGGGAGRFAHTLIERGFKVDCVSLAPLTVNIWPAADGLEVCVIVIVCPVLPNK